MKKYKEYRLVKGDAENACLKKSTELNGLANDTEQKKTELFYLNG